MPPTFDDLNGALRMVQQKFQRVISANLDGNDQRIQHARYLLNDALGFYNTLISGASDEVRAAHLVWIASDQLHERAA